MLRHRSWMFSRVRIVRPRHRRECRPKAPESRPRRAGPSSRATGRRLASQPCPEALLPKGRARLPGTDRGWAETAEWAIRVWRTAFRNRPEGLVNDVGPSSRIGFYLRWGELTITNSPVDQKRG